MIEDLFVLLPYVAINSLILNFLLKTPTEIEGPGVQAG